MSKTAGRILVIRGGAIGDFILTLPVLTALRAQFPHTRLELLGYPHIAQLALAGGLVDCIRSIEARPLAGFFARAGELSEDWCDYFAGFAVIISFLYDPDLIFQSNVARCSKAQFIAGPHRPDETAQEHACDVFLKPLTRLAIFDPDPVPRLLLGNSPAGEPLATPPIPRIALHPGSGSERKNWPEMKWAELLRMISRSTAVHFLMVGGEAEGDRLERLSSVLSVDRVRLALKLPLDELGRRLSACTAFVGHDSGITHLAAALGAPGVVLWANTPLAVWRPRSERLTVLTNPGGIESLEAAKVMEALRRISGL